MRMNAIFCTAALLMVFAALGCTLDTSGPNRPPVALAGPDRSAPEGQTVFLDGSGSYDPDGDPLSYRWTVLLAAADTFILSDDSEQTAGFLAQEPGIYMIALLVSDGELESERDLVILHVSTSVECTGPAQCNDANACTVDDCVEHICVNEALPAGDVCGLCQRCSAGGECLADPSLNDDCRAICMQCAPGGGCENQPAGSDIKGECPDELFCDGVESCDGSGACAQTGDDPCPGLLNCDEQNDTCTNCLLDSDCPACQRCDQNECLPQAEGVDSKDDCVPVDCLTGDCDGTGACERNDEFDCGTCLACGPQGLCTPVAAGTPCDDLDPCMSDDTCDAEGHCLPGAVGKDTDLDGQVDVACGGDDCDDADITSFLGAPEACDGNDNACTGSLASNETDDDGDGYVECNNWSDTQNDDPSIIGGSDCDDDDAQCGAACHPGGVEGPAGDNNCKDGDDNDCDGFIDCADPDCSRPLLAGFTFEGNVNDYTGNYDGSENVGVGSLFSAESPPGSSGSQSLSLDGNRHVDVPLDTANPFDGSSDFSIVAWFKSSSSQAPVLISSARDDVSGNHSMVVFLNPSRMVYDNFYVAACNSTATGLNDGNWHHYAIVYLASTHDFQVYIDGDPSGSNSFNPSIPSIANDTVRIGNTLNTEYPAETGSTGWFGNIDDLGIYHGALVESEVEDIMNNGFCFTRG